MKKTKILLGVLGVFFLGSLNAQASDNRPGAVTLNLADAYYHFASKRKLDNINLPNIALTYNFDQHWAAEAGVGLVNTNTTSKNLTPNQGVHGFLYTADGIYRFNPYKTLEPYAIAGIGVLGLKPNGSDSEHQGNINAGLGAQLFMTHSIAFRGEARDIYTMSGGKNDYMINLGMSFLFDTCL